MNFLLVEVLTKLISRLYRSVLLFACLWLALLTSHLPSTQDYVWKASFDRFCRSPALATVMFKVMQTMSKTRFEATRFLQLFLSHVTLDRNLTFKQAAIDNLLRAFAKPSTNNYAEPIACLAKFHPEAPNIFQQRFIPRHAQAAWPGDAAAVRDLSATLVGASCQLARNQYMAAWRKHILYNIDDWTVSWIKSRLKEELGDVWDAYPRWKRGKLAWSLYTFFSVGVSDGIDFAKRAKEAEKKRKRGQQVNELAVAAEYELPKLRDDDAEWEDVVHRACTIVLDDLRVRFGPVDQSKRDTGGLLLGSSTELRVGHQLGFLRFLSGLRDADPNLRKFSLCPLYDWKRAFITVDSATLFYMLQHVRDEVLAEEGAPATLPTKVTDWFADHDAIKAWNQHLFRLNPSSNKGKGKRKKKKQARRRRRRQGQHGPFQQPPRNGPKSRTYSYSFATDCESVSVLFGKRLRVREGDEANQEDDGGDLEEASRDPNGRNYRTGTGAWIGDVDKVPDALLASLAHLPDDTLVAAIDPGIVSPLTGARTTLGDLRANGRVASPENHPLEGLDDLPTFSVSASNVRKYTKSRRREAETQDRLVQALGSREAFTNIGTAKTTDPAAYSDHLDSLFGILDRVWTVTLSNEVAHRRWQGYIASQEFYAKAVPRLVLGEENLKRPAIVFFGAASFKTVRRGRMPVSVRKMRRSLAYSLEPGRHQYLIDTGEDYSSQLCSKPHTFLYPTRSTLNCVKHTLDDTPKPAHGLQLCHHETEYCCGELWARDVNSARNILVIGVFLLFHRVRPMVYTRNFWAGHVY